MTAEDLSYFRQRAASERGLAYRSESPQVAAIHSELARKYQALVDHLRVVLLPARRAWLAEINDQPPWHDDWKNLA